MRPATRTRDDSCESAPTRVDSAIAKRSWLRSAQAALRPADRETAAGMRVCSFRDCRELHPRIDDYVQQIADQLHEQSDQREEVQRAEYDRVIAADQRLIRQEAQAIQREQGLDEDRSRKEGADEGCGKSGDDRDQRVAEHVLVE